MTHVILITGASSGIGYATALAFARNGANVAAVARRVERLADLEREIAGLPGAHGEILSIAADVTDAGAMQQAVEKTVEHFGRLDAVIANAGIGQRGALADVAWSDVEAVLHTNIDGVLHTVRAGIPSLRETKGHIVIVSSVAGITATPYTSVYGASKAFVSHLARSLRLELEDDGITVTELLIGPTETKFNHNRRGAGEKSNATSLPVMTAEQVADGIVHAVETRRKTAVLRLFDRVVLALNSIAPGFIGRQALKRYKPQESSS